MVFKPHSGGTAITVAYGLVVGVNLAGHTRAEVQVAAEWRTPSMNLCPKEYPYRTSWPSHNNDICYNKAEYAQPPTWNPGPSTWCCLSDVTDTPYGNCHMYKPQMCADIEYNKSGAFVAPAAVGDLVVFTPHTHGSVGVFNTSEPEKSKRFKEYTPNGIPNYDVDYVEKSAKFAGAATVGKQVVFAPHDYLSVVVFDTESNSFSEPVTTNDPVTNTELEPGRRLFRGAAAVEGINLVVFAPNHAHDIGLFDLTTTPGKFSTCATGLTNEAKFSGAVSVGHLVVFAPYNDDNVGVYDSSVHDGDCPGNRFLKFPTKLQGTNKFNGAAVVGNKVVFAPFDHDDVGLFDAKSSEFITVKTGLQDNHKFAGAAALGRFVLFAPYNANEVGLLDTVSENFSTVLDTTVTGTYKFNGAVAITNMVVLAPYCQDDIGVFEINSSPVPSSTPSSAPSFEPSLEPTLAPSFMSSSAFSSEPSIELTLAPSFMPSSKPLSEPSTESLSAQSSESTSKPSVQISLELASAQFLKPSSKPSPKPYSTELQSAEPSSGPSMPDKDASTGKRDQWSQGAIISIVTAGLILVIIVALAALIYRRSKRNYQLDLAPEVELCPASRAGTPENTEEFSYEVPDGTCVVDPIDGLVYEEVADLNIDDNMKQSSGPEAA